MLTGCENKRPIVLFSPLPITQENRYSITRNLNVNQRIYYMIIVPRGMKKGTYRVQFVKKDEKSEFYGYNYYRHFDFKIDKNDTKYITDYLVIHQPGWYFVQFFNIEKDINKFITLGDFKVK